MSENKVRVGVRIRPLATSEIESGAETVVNAERNGRVRVNVPSRQNTFDFDWAYGKNAEQRQIYEDTCKPLIESFFDGYNSTVFAYGKFLYNNVRTRRNYLFRPNWKWQNIYNGE
jgi:hypothetical protein